MPNDFWTWGHEETPPIAPGWYAVLICYDEHEGVFPGAGYWDCTAWQQKAVIAYGDKCADEAEAGRVAYEHDPDL